MLQRKETNSKHIDMTVTEAWVKELETKHQDTDEFCPVE